METSWIFASICFLIHPQRGFGATISTMWDETQKNITHHGAAHGNCQDARALGPLRFWAAEHSDGRMVYGRCDVVVSILEYFGVLILQDSLIFVVFWLVYWFIWDNSVTPCDLNAKRQARQQTLTGAARSSKSDKGAQDRPWRAEKTSTFSSFLISSFYSILHGHY